MQTSLSSAQELPITFILVLPIIVIIGVVGLLHICIIRLNPNLRDVVNSKSKTIALGPELPNPFPEINEWLQSHPPVRQNFPPAVIPVFQSNEGCMVEPGRNINEFVLHFTQGGFFSVQANAPLSPEINCFEVTVEHLEDPNAIVAIGFARGPYPHWRLPGWHPHSVAYHTNGRRFVNQGDCVGEKFTIAPNDEMSVARNLANTYYLLLNHRNSECYLVQGAEPITFNRVLAYPNQIDLHHRQYFPIVGANGNCVVRVAMYAHGVDQIMRDAHLQEQTYHHSKNPHQAVPTLSRNGRLPDMAAAYNIKH
jgi:hypothetical protein